MAIQPIRLFGDPVLRKPAIEVVDFDKDVRRLIEDLTASSKGGWYSVISLHGGGSPEAMKMEIWRRYPLGNKVDLVERLLERGVLADQVRSITRNRQPGRCCVNVPACGFPAPGTRSSWPCAPSSASR